MLHEILLALAGHPSSLLDPESFADKQNADITSGLALSVSERQLLATIATLSQLHRRLRQHLDTIVQKHQSMICRATAISLRQTHLQRFQSRILDVEASILRKDTSTVGAYNIVPLAYIVGRFNDWHRRMAWYWDLTVFMLPVNDDIGNFACTGAALMDKLRADAQTGFPDIEEAAIELSRVAELTWLKQLAAWILYGTISHLSKDDFFVQSESGETGQVWFRRRRELLPKFVSDAAASSILFIGKTLNQLRQNQSTGVRSAERSKIDDLVSTHMQLLSELAFPIVPTQLNRNVTAIRVSLSRNVLQDLLPTRTTRIALQSLRRFFLLSDSDFATCLIHEAERRADARWRNMDFLAQQDSVKALQGLSVKDAETSQVLRQTWKLMTSTMPQEEEEDVLEFARKHLTLIASKKAPSRPTTSDSIAEDRLKLSPVPFNDLLFASSASLTLQIKPPIDLFLSTFDIEIYTYINSYLLAIRRAQLRLEDLWRRNSARRPSDTMAQHHVALRKVWATCSAALLLLTEISAYLASNVIGASYRHFEAWACESVPVSSDHNDRWPAAGGDGSAQKDPETLAAGHRVYLDSLAHGLLLTDVGYTRAIRSLLGVIDLMTSLFVRVMDTRRKDALGSDLMSSTSTNAELKEQYRLQNELSKTCQKVDNDLRNVLNRLRELHQLRVGPDRYFDTSGSDTGGFEPWKAGGLDHVLMKLEFGQTIDKAHE